LGERPTSVRFPVPPRERDMWPSRRQPRRSLWPQFVELIAIVGFLFLVYHVTMWAWVRTAPKETSVPEIAGLKEREALALLEAAGLRSEVVVRKSSEEVPESGVMKAEPGPGRRVKNGRIVRLTVSTGSVWANIPDVTDMSVDRARALLREAKLVVRRERARYHPKVPVGYVIGQTPGAGEKVRKGTEVDLLVSKGPQPETETVETAPLPEGTRSVSVDLTVPPGASLQEVRIVVEDSSGQREAYRAYHQPGEKVTKEVSGQGPKIVVRVFLSGLLVQERSI